MGTTPRSWWWGPLRPSGRIHARWPRSFVRGVAGASGRAGGRHGRTGPHAVDGERSEVEDERRAGEREELTDGRSPLPSAAAPPRAGQVLVTCNHGDRRRRQLVPFAGRVIDTYESRCWMDPAPTGAWAPAGVRASGQDRPSGPPGLPPAGGRRLRLLGNGVRHDGVPAPAARCRGDGQRRDMGAREASDGFPLRLLRGRGASKGVATTRWSKPWEGTASSWSSPEDLRPALERAFASGRPAGGGEFTDPGGRTPPGSPTSPSQKKKRSRPRHQLRAAPKRPNQDGQGYVP